VRGFYEDYQKEKRGEERQRDRPAVIYGGAGAAAIGFFHKFLAAVLYLAATALSSVGLTTLLNKPLRDMLLELACRTFFGN
jgi:hypothetical protein